MDADGVTYRLRLEPTGLDLSIPPGRSLLVGRAADADVVIGDLRVSREHFRLTNRGGELSVVDLRPYQATLINGASLPRGASQRLSPGDVVRFCDFRLRVRDDTEEPAG